MGAPEGPVPCAADRRPEGPIPWQLGELALAVALALLAFLVARHVPGLANADVPGRWFVESVVRNAVFVAVPFLLMAIRHRRSPLEALLPARRVFSDFAWGLELALILCSMNLLAMRRALPELQAMDAAASAGTLADPPLPAHFLGVYRIHNMRELVLFFFGWGIFPAIGEEVLFRGLIYTALRRRMSALSAVLLSAAVFALYHYPVGVAPHQLHAAHLHPILAALILGLVVAAVYEYSGSLLAPVMAHMGLNVSFVVFLAMGAELARLVPAALPVAALAVFTLHFFVSSRYLFRRGG